MMRWLTPHLAAPRLEQQPRGIRRKLSDRVTRDRGDRNRTRSTVLRGADLTGLGLKRPLDQAQITIEYFKATVRIPSRAGVDHGPRT
jgi:hypothetical protein